MESNNALLAFGALAHEGRLEVFRCLVRRSPPGLPAGEIARELGVPPSTLSFHLRQLEAAGLIAARREGRVLRYAVRQETVQELFWFLGEDCCQGRVELCPPPTFRIQADLEEARTRSLAAAPLRVLFVCSRNSARSQMAEAILRHLAPELFEVRSAGIRAHELHPLTVRVLEERGLDVSGLHAKDLSEFLGKGPIDIAVVVCDLAQEHCERIYPFARELLFWPFDDPVGEDDTHGEEALARFRRVRDEIWRALGDWSASFGTNIQLRS